MAKTVKTHPRLKPYEDLLAAHLGRDLNKNKDFAELPDDPENIKEAKKKLRDFVKANRKANAAAKKGHASPKSSSRKKKEPVQYAKPENTERLMALLVDDLDEGEVLPNSIQKIVDAENRAQRITKTQYAKLDKYVRAHRRCPKDRQTMTYVVESYRGRCFIPVESDKGGIRRVYIASKK
jgi:hypothetical protein